jgi:hypothetical protein
MFWTFLAAIVGSVIWAAFASDKMTADENSLIWAAVFCLVFMAFSGGLTFAWIWFLKKRVAMIAGRYGGGIQFFRDSQPVRYWMLMAFYLLVILMSIFCVCGGVRDMWIIARHIVSGGQQSY